MEQTIETKDVGSNLTAIAEYTETAAALAELRQRHQGVVYDVTVPKQMKAAKDGRAELRTLRVNLEKKRVELKAPVLERGRLIDTEAKRITDELVALEEPIDVQIKTEEARAEDARIAKLEAERLRVEAINKRIDEIRNLPASLVGKPAVIIQGKLAKLREDVLSEDEFAEHYLAACDAHTACIARVEQLLQAQVEAEAEKRRQAERDAEMEAMQTKLAEQQRLIDEAEEAKRVEQERLAQVERDRVAAVRQELMNKIARIGQPFHRCADVSKAQCIDMLAQARALELTEDEFGDLLASAEAARDSAVEQIHDAMQVLEQIAQERIEREEQDRIRAEQAEADRVRREQEEAALQAERDRQAAEQRRLDQEAQRLQRELEEAATRAEGERVAKMSLIEAANDAHVLLCTLAPTNAATVRLGKVLKREAAGQAPARAKKAANA